MAAEGPEKNQLIDAIVHRLQEITDKKIRSKWELIVKEAANGTIHSPKSKIEDAKQFAPQHNSIQKVPKKGI